MAVTDEHTTEAFDLVQETMIYFTDFITEGEVVDLWEDAEDQIGYQGQRVVVHNDIGWLLRELTSNERERWTAEWLKRNPNPCGDMV